MPPLSSWLKTILLLRPPQTYKAAVVFLPALFHGHGSIATHWAALSRLALAWGISSALVYVLNDLKDLPDDRRSTHRSHRPLASGSVLPIQAAILALLLGLSLSALLPFISAPGRICIFAYLLLNAAYSLGFKKILGLQQTMVALGFWLRLQSGGSPTVPIPITPWASAFTLGLAYYLNCLKGFGLIPEADHTRRWAMGIGAGLAGSLALVALCSVCFKRAMEGTMAFPELPPLLALLGLHRYAYRAAMSLGHQEQSSGFFGDPVTLGGMAAFLASFLLQ